MPGFENPMIQVLDVSSNLLTGLIPIINATSLLSLNATNNSLTGSIPDYLCTNSSFLISLAISYNELTGKIPPILGNCTNLRDFIAESNNLVGSLPDELLKLASLQNLCLSDNTISGFLNGAMIPQLQNLINLDLSTNFLTGSIPEAIGQLTKLQYLNLGNNNLTGMLPSAIENCNDLRQLNLQTNSLSGTLQFINFTKHSNLELLDLFNNSLTGEIPESIYTYKNLNALRLSSNNLSGQISSEIESLRALSFLSLAINNLTNITGALENLSKCKNLTVLILAASFIGEALLIEPTCKNGFENIQLLSLAYNNFSTCIIPTWISKLTKLEILLIPGNQFVGHIPDWLGNLSDLFYVDLSHNYLFGDIPPSITHLPSLNLVHKISLSEPSHLELPIYLRLELHNRNTRQYKQLTAMPPTINLSNNQLNGTIPQGIGRLKMLLKLDLSGNNLSSPIPKSIGNLTSLEILDLSRNELTGQIPASLTVLHFLSTFSVAYNNLSGPVPFGDQLTTFSSSSYEGNNLCRPVVMRNCSNLSHGDDETLLTSDSFDRNTVIAVLLGYFFGVVAVVLVQFH